MNCENYKKCENFKEKVSLFDSFIDYSNGSWEQISPTEKRITFSCSKYETGQPKVVTIKCKIFKESPKLVNEKIHLCDTCGIRNCPTRVLIKDTVTHCSSYILKQPNNKKLCLGCEHSKDIDCTKRPITNIAFFCERYIKKQPDIYVPDGIQFTKSSPGFGLGLEFNSGKQDIYYDYTHKIFRCCFGGGIKRIRPKLFLCEKGDIGVGEWGFANDFEDGNFKEKGRYFLNIGKTFICILHDTFIQPVNFSYNYWWKIVEVGKEGK